MKTIGAAITAALLLGCAATGRAGEPIPAPHDFAAGDAPAASPSVAPGNGSPMNGAPMFDSPENSFPGGSGCACCGATCGHHWNLRAWLGYHTLYRASPCQCCACCGRWVPLYLYFLGNCQEHPCTACGCAGGCCGCAGRAWSGAPTGVGFVGH